MTKDNLFYAITSDEIDDAILILSEAFKNDPIAKWVSEKEGYTEFLYGMLVPFYVENGYVLMNKEKTIAMLYQEYPESQSFEPTIRQIIKFAWKFGIGSLMRILKVSNTFDRIHYKKPHLYVCAVGIKSDCVSKGLGSEIFDHIRLIAKEKNKAIYGENSNVASNEIFYEKARYTALGNQTIGKSGPVFCPLLWTPD